MLTQICKFKQWDLPKKSRQAKDASDCLASIKCAVYDQIPKSSPPTNRRHSERIFRQTPSYQNSVTRLPPNYLQMPCQIVEVSLSHAWQPGVTLYAALVVWIGTQTGRIDRRFEQTEAWKVQDDGQIHGYRGWKQEWRFKLEGVNAL